MTKYNTFIVLILQGIWYMQRQKTIQHIFTTTQYFDEYTFRRIHVMAFTYNLLLIYTTTSTKEVA